MPTLGCFSCLKEKAKKRARTVENGPIGALAGSAKEIHTATVMLALLLGALQSRVLEGVSLTPCSPGTCRHGLQPRACARPPELHMFTQARQYALPLQATNNFKHFNKQDMQNCPPAGVALSSGSHSHSGSSAAALVITSLAL